MNEKKFSLEHLTEEQRYVTQESGTERPYENKFWDFFEQGIYVDIVSHEVLFASVHKFSSQCGWPSFFKSCAPENIVYIKDQSHGMQRVEVRSRHADSHLGHIFTDGPAPTGVRFCINSAALKFIPKAELKDEYEKYLSLFNKDEIKLSGEAETLILGGGCFWGVEAILQETLGVLSTECGYSGGDIKNPTYEQISQGKTGHAEVVKVSYDPQIVATQELLDLFFRLHDPTTLNYQGYDMGTQYRSVLYYTEDSQRLSIDEALKKAEKYYQNPIVTEVKQLSVFYPAEDQHQSYYKKKYQGQRGPICHYVRGV